MWLSLERDLDLHGEEEMLARKGGPQDVEHPYAKDHGVEETNQADKFQARWAEGVHVAIPPCVRWGDVKN